jgi:hypothetical protein
MLVLRTILSVIWHVVVGAFGFYLILLTFVMKESTEGIWVNRIEVMWVRIDDRSKAVGETTRALCKALAEKIAAAFDRIVGPRMISIRVIGISSALSFTSCFFVLGFFLEAVSYLILAHSDVIERSGASGARLVHVAPVLVGLGICFLIVAGLCLTAAVLPVLRKSSVWAWLSCAPMAVWLLLTFRLIYKHLEYGSQLGLSIALACSIASDLLLLVLIRKSLHWIVARSTIARIIVSTTVQVVILPLLFSVPFVLPMTWWPNMSKSSLGLAVFMLAVFNIPTAIASLAFGISLLVVLLHRITWPFLSTWTYVLTRNEVFNKRKTIRGISTLMIIYGLSGFVHSAALGRIIELVRSHFG